MFSEQASMAFTGRVAKGKAEQIGWFSWGPNLNQKSRRNARRCAVPASLFRPASYNYASCICVVTYIMLCLLNSLLSST